MRVITSTSAMVALMATNTHCFQVSPWGLSSKSTSTSALRQSSSYDEQLKKYYQGGLQEPVLVATPPPVGQAQQPPPPIPVQQTPPPVPVYQAPPPPPPVSVTTPQIVKNENDLKIPNAGILFLGLPLWLLVTVQVFFGGNNSPATTATQMPLPAQMARSAPSAATPAGVVVLSQPITKAEVRKLFDLWNDALQTLDPAIVAKRYAKDGVLLPTLSDVPRNDAEGIKDYFVGFLKKKPVGKILEGEIFVGNNWAQDAGIYEFTFEDGSKVKARYSFVYALEDGKWMISHHHSSLMPQEVVRPTPVTEDQVRGFFGLWNDALATGDPQKVADRYSRDAVLLPTLSDSARYTNAQIADYFVGFLKKKPTGEILEGNVKIGPNWAQDAGIYEFTFENGSKTRGRYSFVYTFENGEWKISNHHSSIMPEPAVRAMKATGAM
mmetsp:Transcript_12164/g.17599  ORF Transcript_12164/g.17599 Transcript_12164/m.17599 type:complete len:437 (-) Transcript_12164:322-1632(-)|eukprot:CAMPEP_0195516810 /NCGR_PEP_ID=MMETSP0794_2-20130614/8793_1 /TAXON_ID=515487 /ORGANISM="Stephanopyxis turris, Strain CCMP 815" /LENGTH=436 /DNA_ID=CAMNT_0040645499 /DNA_START=93 /DNA_END=1403 /DNA_ORIENTATION=+